MKKTTKLALLFVIGGILWGVFTSLIAPVDVCRWWGLDRGLTTVLGMVAVICISKGVCIWDSLSKEERDDGGSS